MTIAGCASETRPNMDWEQFRAHFIEPDGRVIDSGNGGISHSEGQGIALLLAVHYDDRATFSSIWEWTRSQLQTREDKLLAWSWSADAGVGDPNNATDGDLLVAWALARAGKHWKEAGYLDEARIISQEIRQRLLHEDVRGLVLLPGTEGFVKPEGLVVNLSYWVFPALRELDELDPAPEWQAVQDTGIALLREARFGRWGLPADWMTLSRKIVPADDFPARFGYDAVRIPLYLLWAGVDTPQLLEPFQRYWAYFAGARFMPAWTDFADDSIDSYDGGPGIRAIAHLSLSAPNLSSVRLPELDPAKGYYASALLLLCKLMLAERSQ